MKLHAVVAATAAAIYASMGGCASTPEPEIQEEQVISYETNAPHEHIDDSLI